MTGRSVRHVQQLQAAVEDREGGYSHPTSLGRTRVILGSAAFRRGRKRKCVRFVECWLRRACSADITPWPPKCVAGQKGREHAEHCHRKPPRIGCRETTLTSSRDFVARLWVIFSVFTNAQLTGL